MSSEKFLKRERTRYLLGDSGRGGFDREDVQTSEEFGPFRDIAHS